MKYQLNLVTPLGTLASEEYDSEGKPMGTVEAMEIADFLWEKPYGFRTEQGVRAVVGAELARNSILLVKEIEEEEAE